MVDFPYSQECKYAYCISSLSGSETFHWRDLLENYSLIIHSFNKYVLTIYHVDTALTSQSIQSNGKDYQVNRYNQDNILKMLNRCYFNSH